VLKISQGDFEVFLKIVIMVAVIVGAAFLLYLLWLLRSVLILFLISLVFVFLLRPAVDWLSNGKIKFPNGKNLKLRIPRILSVLIVIIIVFAIIFFIAVPTITTMIDQANSLFNSVKTNLSAVSDNVTNWITNTFKINNKQVQTYLASIQTNIEEFLYNTVKSLPGLLQNIFTTFAGYLFNTFIILIITIFFLLDWHKINEVLFSLLPQKTADTAKGLLGAVYKQIWDYIKAQATLSFMIGTLIAILCIILGLKDVFLIIGIVVALGEMVPYVGPLISFSVGLLLVLVNAVTTGNFSLLLWYAGGFLVIEQILAQAVAAPLIAKKANTHPLLVILVMFSFTTLFSPYAVLLAVPFLVFAKAIIGYLVGEQKVLEKLGIALEPSAPPLSPLITRLRKPTTKKDPAK
jgi:predicted PurR-regulated permease PerM